jgi:curved DNA-binding protein CbpA
MGNLISIDDNEISVIKKLYKLNKEELKIVFNHVKKERLTNIELGFINSIKNTHYKLKDKINNDSFKLVNTFLENIVPMEEKVVPKPREYVVKEMLSIFNLHNSKYTEQELKLSYKKLAMRYHPDRPNGNNDKFQLITRFYNALMEDLKLKEEDKQFNELKMASQDYITKQTSDNKQNTKLNRFEPKLFNKIFEENRIEEDDDGYTKWIESNSLSDKDIKKNNKLSGNFNSNSFNTTFEQEIEHPKDIVIYKIPEGLFSSSSIQPQELGSTKQNYTTNTYSDFKEAHTTQRIGGINTRLENYNSVDELKHKRENIVKLSQTELEELEVYNQNKKKQDEDRQINLKRKDERHFSNYSKIHDRMLQSNILR